MNESLQNLVTEAQTVRAHAHAPYSSYPVGAAVLDEQGQIHAAANVENASYPVGICAERAAIAQMVSAGGTQIEAIAVVTANAAPPCGMCLQMILEFAPEPSGVRILMAEPSGKVREAATLADLLPRGFRSAPRT